MTGIEAALRELLRLYDWRFELARAEQKQLNDEEDGEDFDATRAAGKALDADLRRYGREKKAAWATARSLLNAAPQPSTAATVAAPLQEGAGQGDAAVAAPVMAVVCNQCHVLQPSVEACGYCRSTDLTRLSFTEGA